MDEVLAADRPKFTLGEQAGQRDRSDIFLDGPGIVIRLGKQPGSTSVAAKEQCGLWEIRIRTLILLKELHQILISRFRVTDVELNRLTDAHLTCNNDRPVIGSSPNHIRNQKVSTRKGVLIFVHHDS